MLSAGCFPDDTLSAGFVGQICREVGTMNGYPGNRRNSDIETTAHSMMVAKSDSTAKRLVDALLSSHFRDAGWSAMVWELLTEMIRHKELFAEFVANEPRRNLLRLEPEA